MMASALLEAVNGLLGLKEMFNDNICCDISQIRISYNNVHEVWLVAHIYSYFNATVCSDLLDQH